MANADGVTIYYNFTNDQTELEVTYKGDSYWTVNSYAGKVVIPESVTYEGNTYPVTSIGFSAFYRCSSLTSATIPNSVTAIGRSAFEGCSSLTSATIPNSVTAIDWNAFQNCFNLTEVTIGNSVTSIGMGAFMYCSGLTKLTIPNSVTFIGEMAFCGCSGLTELTIPGSVTTIRDDAFESCSGLEKITVEDGNPNYDSRENCNAIINTNTNELITGCKNTIIPNSVTSIGNYAFESCSGLTELTIPGSVTSIGDYAFSGCRGLTELTIPSSVTSIGDYAFSRCSGLEKMSVESGNPIFDSRENCNAIIKTNTNELITGCKNTIIPNSVTSIGNYAFYYCYGLTELTIPSSVTSIGDAAFYECFRLTTIYSLNTTPPSVANTNAFSKSDPNLYETVDVFVPAEALAAYQTAEVWKDFQKLQGFDPTAIAKVTAAEQIQSANGQITVTGLTDGTTVTVYDLSGKQVGTATSKGGQVNISTGMTAGAAAIVKVGERSVKTVMK